MCNSRRVLAIDPGPESSAYVLWDGRTVLDAQIVPNDELVSTALCSQAAMAGTGPTVAIEDVRCYGMPVGREVFETCIWIGRFAERFAPLDVCRVPRSDIKLHHCHSARAKDVNVRAALVEKYGERGCKKEPGVTYRLKSHLWAAFALATFWTETQAEEEMTITRGVS